MPIKLGNRVTVLPGVSNRMDAGSTWDDNTKEAGIPRAHCEGMRGEVVEIAAVDHPSGWPRAGMVLVDSQIKDGQPVGKCFMREWLLPEEVEVG